MITWKFSFHFQKYNVPIRAVICSGFACLQTPYEQVCNIDVFPRIEGKIHVLWQPANKPCNYSTFLLALFIYFALCKIPCCSLKMQNKKDSLVAVHTLISEDIRETQPTSFFPLLPITELSPLHLCFLATVPKRNNTPWYPYILYGFARKPNLKKERYHWLCLESSTIHT